MYPMGAQRETREREARNTFPLTTKAPVADRGLLFHMAERVGFEPTEACTSLVFKTRALNHSTTSPKVQYGL